MAISNIESLIEETVAFAQSGNRLLAEFHFRKLMQDCHADIEDPAVWFMMAWLAPSPQAMSQVLERFLAIDPRNELAQWGLRWARGITRLAVNPAEVTDVPSSSFTDIDCNLDIPPLSDDSSDSTTVSQALDTVESVVHGVQETFGSPASDSQTSVSEFGFVPLEDSTTDEQYARLFAEQAELDALEQLSVGDETLADQVDPFTDRKNTIQSVDFSPESEATADSHCSESPGSESPAEVEPLEISVTDVSNPMSRDSRSGALFPSFNSNESSDRVAAHTVSELISVTDAVAAIETPVAAQLEPDQSVQSTAQELPWTPVNSVDGITLTTGRDEEFAAEETQFETVTAIDELDSDAIDSNSLGIEVTQDDAFAGTPDASSLTDRLSNITAIRLDESLAGTPATPKGDKPNDIPGVRRPAGPSILVVDDSPTVRKLLTMMLSQGGYEVSSAVDGLDAVQSIASHVPQLIITDINMPRLDGYKLCKLVTRNARTRHIPVVMISAGIIDRLRGKLAGCSGYLAKPITPGSLNAVVEFALQESSVR